eukprot:TRINITY_DN13_c1_g1_i1.p1 TRINITY_DN13_c1_g1~~TRINITY_DN13_c1_g1_i1.p1  ORF type:complete len:372 (+),score=199.10 TRINITY_DN13_c1_g1_i1:148-1263(+)
MSDVAEERPPPEDEPSAKKKRGAERGLSQADIDGEEKETQEPEPQTSGQFAKADEDTLKKRRIIKVRRKGSSALEPENANALQEAQSAPAASSFNINALKNADVEKKEENAVQSENPKVEEKKVEEKKEEKPAETVDSSTSSAEKTEEKKTENSSERVENSEEKKEEKKDEKGPFGFFSVASPFSFESTSSSPFSAFSAPTNSTFNFATTSTFGSSYSAGSSQSEEGSDNPSDFVPTSSFTPSINLPVSSEPLSTGEEDETNVYTFKLAKLYGLEEGSWKERGEGTLKINEAKDGSYSRVLLRTAGILALKLNSRIFSNMAAEKVGAKQVRFMGTSMEKSGEMAPYLVRFKETSDAVTFVNLIEAQIKKKN